MSGTANNGLAPTSLGAANSGPFNIIGGIYAVSTVASSYGTGIDLQALGPDAATFVSCLGGTLISANGQRGPLYLPAGQYKIVNNGGAGLYASVVPVMGV